MKRLALALCLISCQPKVAPPKPHALKGTFVPSLPPNPGQLLRLSWGALTVDGGNPAILLDGGAGTYFTDPIALGGIQDVAMSGASIACTPAESAGAASGSVNAQFSNDTYLWFPTGNTAALLDAGAADGGTPGSILVSATAAPYARVALTTVAALTAVGDAGFFCDAGVQGVSIIGECDAGIYSSYIDAGTNFCDGGNFCDAGPNSYDLAYSPTLACTAVTLPQ